MDRRQLITGAGATALVATMPAVAAVAEIANPAIERMKSLLHQLFGLLRSEGYATAQLRDGGQDPVLAERPTGHRIDVRDVAR